MNTQEENYERLLKLVPELVTSSKEEWNQNGEFAVQFESPGMMKLNIDLLMWENESFTIALSHYYRHESGDMVPDPDMEIEINPKEKTARAISYQDIFGYRTVESAAPDQEEISKELDNFLGHWLKNIESADYQQITQKKEHEMNLELK